MIFYGAEEDTPLLSSAIQSSPKSDTDDSIHTKSFGSSTSYHTNTNDRRSNQTEVHLSVDKVSFLYSPRSPAYNTFTVPRYDIHEEDELSLLDPYFDVTASRLRAAFDSVHPDGKILDFYSFVAIFY
jgi:hypothetical protein